MQSFASFLVRILENKWINPMNAEISSGAPSKKKVPHKRPRNIDVRSLVSYQLPLPGIASIIHRITGGITFLMIPFLVWLLSSSLASPESFARIQDCLDSFFMKLILWGVLSSLAYHLVAGVKHLVMDFGHAETLEGADLAAKVTFAVSGFLFLMLGVWIW